MSLNSHSGFSIDLTSACLLDYSSDAILKIKPGLRSEVEGRS